MLKMASHTTLELRSKKLVKGDLSPWLKIIGSFLSAADAIISNGHAAPEFIQSMIIVASQIFIPESERFQKFINKILEANDEEDGTYGEQEAEERLNETFMVSFAISSANRMPGCRAAIEKIQVKVLRMLNAVCLHRLNL